MIIFLDLRAVALLIKLGVKGTAINIFSFNKNKKQTKQNQINKHICKYTYGAVTCSYCQCE